MEKEILHFIQRPRWSERHEGTGNGLLEGQGFMKRNGHKVKAKKRMNSIASWPIDVHMQTLNSCITSKTYKEMVKGGIAEELDEEVWLNKEGHTVATEEESFGMKTKYMLKHPGKLLFVDEVGNNTSQAKDGQMRG